MKAKFASTDICAVVQDLKKLLGMRIVNVYDINSKTYLLKLHRSGDKAFILFESGVRIHITTHDWAKSQMPSGFSMKFRKHIKQKRLTNVSQVGTDRIVDMTFGDEERACHVIVELYDRGNIVLTDADYKILNVLRPRTDKDTDVRFSVRETYPLNLARQDSFIPSTENIKLFLESTKPTEQIRKALIKHVPFNSQLLEHSLIVAGLPSNAQVKDVGPGSEGAVLLSRILQIADETFKSVTENPSKGYITFKKVTRPDGTEEEAFQDYHSIAFAQLSQPNSQVQLKEFPSFSEAVDKIYSSLDTQKIQQTSTKVENEATKKLDNIKRDHERRLKALEEVQELKQRRAELVEMNKDLVDKCLTIIRQALANKMSWNEIQKWLSSAATQGNQLAQIFVRLDLKENIVVLRLTDPYEHLDENSDSDNYSEDSEDDEDAGAKPSKKPKKPNQPKGTEVELDLDLNAGQNARKHFGDRKAAASKQIKTLQSTSIALKNAQKQAKNKVKQVRTNTTVARARKPMWFEKFYWCISSEGFLIIGGRDAQQNEMIVKRYMRPGDIYVHADIGGASSVLIRNKARDIEIPPMTLNEAGSMSICYSKAWDEKVVVSAWWVHHDQVSRTAPTGEYLTAGSFMIRGKKNYLPSVQLQLGYGLMFRIDEESTERHLAAKHAKLSSRTVSMSTNANAEEILDDGGENELNADENEQHADDEETTESDHNHERDSDAEDEHEEEFPDVEVDLDSMDINSRTAANDETEEAILSSLTANPRPDDGLLFLVAVCAPYSAMQKFKYKVKITPGGGKRGKAVKTALALFQADKTATPAERTLIKLLASDPSNILQLPSKVNMLAPNLLSLKK